VSKIDVRSIATGFGFIVLLFLFACDGFTHIQSKVSDTNGKPIEGAHVEMKTSGHHEEVKTDNQGSFSVGFTHPPFNVDLVLTVSKDGYKTFEKSFKARDAKEFPSTIVMEAAQPVEPFK